MTVRMRARTMRKMALTKTFLRAPSRNPAVPPKANHHLPLVENMSGRQ
jgi:hypothetical protein